MKAGTRVATPAGEGIVKRCRGEEVLVVLDHLAYIRRYRWTVFDRDQVLVITTAGWKILDSLRRVASLLRV